MQTLIRAGRRTRDFAGHPRLGFALLDAGPEQGILSTRPVQFSGNRLCVNVDGPNGELRVEVVDEQGGAMQPFTANLCCPIIGNSIKAKVAWRDGPNLATMAGQPAQFRFLMHQSSLYSSWVSASPDGCSGGLLAARSPSHADQEDG